MAQKSCNIATVLDVKSGNPQMIIDADMEICGVGITGNRITLISDGKVVTWELSAGDCVLDPQWNIDNSIQTTEFKTSRFIGYPHASISPNLNYIAFAKNLKGYVLYIRDLDTGDQLGARTQGWIPGFTPDGNRVWCANSNGQVDQWAIVEDDGTHAIKLESLDVTEKPLSGFSWHSSCGYQITDDGWVLSPSGKQLI